MPSPNSRPNIQASTTANPPRPPAPVICAAPRRKPCQSPVATGPSLASSWGSVVVAAASSIEPLITEMPITIAADPTRPTVEPASFTISAQIAAFIVPRLLVVGAHGLEECVLDLGGVGGEIADQAPGVHHDDAVGDAGHLVEVVTADQDGRAVPGSPEQALAQPDDTGRVERVGRLVEHDHRRVVLQCRRDTDPLAVAERQRSDSAVRVLLERELGEHAVDGRRHVDDSAQASAQLEVASSRQLGIGERVLDEVPDLRPFGQRRRTELVPVQQRAPALRPQHPEQHAHQGRLAGAVQSDERHDPTGRQVEVDVEDAGAVPEGARCACSRASAAVMLRPRRARAARRRSRHRGRARRRPPSREGRRSSAPIVAAAAMRASDAGAPRWTRAPEIAASVAALLAAIAPRSEGVRDTIRRRSRTSALAGGGTDLQPSAIAPIAAAIGETCAG